MECSKNVNITNVIIALLGECSKNVIIKNFIIALLVERSKNVIIKNIVIMLLMEFSINVSIKNVIIALLVERSKNVIMKNVIIVLLVERSKNDDPDLNFYRFYWIFRVISSQNFNFYWCHYAFFFLSLKLNWLLYLASRNRTHSLLISIDEE